MKTYGTLIESNGREALGSFSTIRLDGRNSLDTMKTDCFLILERENKFAGYKRYNGFNIYQGLGLQSAHVIYANRPD